MEQTAEKKKMDEITIKFGKGCVGEPFTGKDGKEYKQILIPNKDENDHSPWATFVARSNAVHEDQYGKGMWMKLPADGNIPQYARITASVRAQMEKRSGRLKRPRYPTEI